MTEIRCVRCLSLSAQSEYESESKALQTPVVNQGKYRLKKKSHNLSLIEMVFGTKEKMVVY